MTKTCEILKELVKNLKPTIFFGVPCPLGSISVFSESPRRCSKEKSVSKINASNHKGNEN